MSTAAATTPSPASTQSSTTTAFPVSGVRFTPCPMTPAPASRTNLRARQLTATDRGYDMPVPDGRLLTEQVAELVLPDGQLGAGSGYGAAAGDDDDALGPFVRLGPGPLTGAVVLSVLDSPSWGRRVAFLEIRLRPEHPVRWDEDTRLFIGTDGGDGGFVSASALQHPDPDGEAYLDAIEAEDDENLMCFLRQEAQTTGGTLDGVLFATGIGDGGYPTLLGRDVSGQVVSVVSYGLIVPWALSGLPGTPPAQVLEETWRRAAHPDPTNTTTETPTTAGSPAASTARSSPTTATSTRTVPARLHATAGPGLHISLARWIVGIALVLGAAVFVAVQALRRSW